MRVLGIDPGATGALAFLTLSGGLPVNLETVDIPVLRIKGRAVIDEYALAREIDARVLSPGEDGEPLAVATLEQGGVRPQNGRVGAATFWLGIGAIRGVLAAHFIPIKIVPASAWKKNLRVTGDKDASRKRASAIFPRWAGQWSRAKDNGRAEAALIALYGANRLPILKARKSA